MDRLRVLFLCTGDSARSQMAEALFRKLSRGRADVFSAGTSPEPEVHPLALDVLSIRFNVDTADLFPKHLNRFRGHRFDYVITVCDRKAEACPTFPGDPERIHWSFEDPAAVNGEGAQRRAFEVVANGLAARLRIWMALPAVHHRLDAAEERGVRVDRA
jgi:protein-tyrosine-phosphatase